MSSFSIREDAFLRIVGSATSNWSDAFQLWQHIRRTLPQLLLGEHLSTSLRHRLHDLKRRDRRRSFRLLNAKGEAAAHAAALASPLPDDDTSLALDMQLEAEELEEQHNHAAESAAARVSDEEEEEGLQCAISLDPLEDIRSPFLAEYGEVPMPTRQELVELTLMLAQAPNLDAQVTPLINTRYRSVDSLQSPLLWALQQFPAWSLLEEEGLVVHMFVTLGVTDMTFQPYIDAVSANTNTGKRILALLCANALGLKRTAELNDETCLQSASAQAALEDAVFLLTAPLWLEDGQPEKVPSWLAEETMCKPEDAGDAIPTKETIQLFLSKEEAQDLVRQLARDGDTPLQASEERNLIDTFRAQPLWTRLLLAFQGRMHIARAQGDAVREFAALFYSSILAANAANSHAAHAIGVKPKESSNKLEGRLMNYHDAPKGWIHELACTRLKLTEAQGVATIDSIPLSLRKFNVQTLKQPVKDGGAAITERAFVILYHKFLDVNRVIMQHVRHTDTKMLVDSASDLKILLGLYTCGGLARRPTLMDMVC